jgi:O-antigen/teichoic acid export membrane protein
MDFYTYNTRELIGQEKSKQLIFIRDQFIFHILSYTIVLPLLFMIFIFDIVDYQYIFYFYIILILEHLSQELFRLYITLSMSIFANILLFLRMGLWVYVLIFLWFSNINDTQNLYTVYISWIIGSLISVILGFLYLFKQYDINNIGYTKIDWNWIKRGIRISIPFFIGTIAYKIIEFSDRYMIDIYMKKSDVGIYTFFGSIANSMQSIIFVLVVILFYPKLIELYKDNKKEEFSLKLKRFFWETLIYSLIIALGIIIFIHPILDYLKKEEFSDNLDVLWILLVATFIINISFVFHYLLFIKKKDIIIRNITLLGAGLNIGLNCLLIPLFGLLGAAIATLISFGTILGIKFFYSRKEKNEN